MPKFLENILQQAAAAKGLSGRAADRYTYGAMNNMGAMHSNVETPKGAQMEVKHEAKIAKPMHPKMVQRSQMVAEAHQHLGQAIPGFHQLPGRQKMMAAQHYVNLRLGKVR